MEGNHNKNRCNASDITLNKIAAAPPVQWTDNNIHARFLFAAIVTVPWKAIQLETGENMGLHDVPSVISKFFLIIVWSLNREIF